MATTTKSTARKKTKTTRKVSASTARKSTAKKVAPKKRTTAVKKTTAATKKAAAEVSAEVKNTTVKQSKSSSSAMEQLRRLNLFMVFASVLQAALILWKSAAFGGIREISATYPTTDTMATLAGAKPEIVMATHRLFDVHLSWMIAGFWGVTALMHVVLATWMRKRYEKEIDSHINHVRWATYATAGSGVLVTIALAAGMNDLTTLLGIVAFTAIGSLAALSREHLNQNKERSRLVYAVGGIAVLAPWVMFLINILGTHQYGSGSTPSAIYWLYATGLAMVLIIAKILRSQTKGNGRLADYVLAEKMYIWLQLVGYTAITWQVYAAFLK